MLAVIIVNFRTPDLTIDCLESLAPEVAANPGTRVVVVENGSGDDSERRIRDRLDSSGWRSWCSLVVSDINKGFSGGNNLGTAFVIRDGGAKYFLLLNSDTRVHRGCFAYCIDKMERDPRIGALSCRIVGMDGVIQNTCRRFPTPLRLFVAALSLPWRYPALFSWADVEDKGWDRNTVSRDVDWIGGAFMLLRGDWIARHKGLDERFFFYGEDVELCHRIWQTGFRCYYDPTATVVHVGGASSDPTRMASDERNSHRLRGRYLIQRICYGRLAEWFVRCIDLAMLALRVGWGRLLGNKGTPEDTARVRDLRLLSRDFTK